MHSCLQFHSNQHDKFLSPPPLCFVSRAFVPQWNGQQKIGSENPIPVQVRLSPWRLRHPACFRWRRDSKGFRRRCNIPRLEERAGSTDRPGPKCCNAVEFRILAIRFYSFFVPDICQFLYQIFANFCTKYFPIFVPNTRGVRYITDSGVNDWMRRRRLPPHLL